MAKRNTPSTALFGKNSRFVWGGLIGLGVILAVIAKFSQNIQSPQSVLFSEKKSQVVKPPQDNYSDFPKWQRVENFVELFHFAMPDFFSIKTVSEKTQYELESVRTVGTSLIHLSVLPYATFQEQKRVLDAGGEKQFGWTNAYGASVFEYQNDHLTVFVVDKEKKEVVKLVTDESKYFPVTRNIARTFESTKPEKDIHGPFYVNFIGKYKIRYPAELEPVAEVAKPFSEFVKWTMHLKNSENTGWIEMSVVDQQSSQKEFTRLVLQTDIGSSFVNPIDGQSVKIIRELKVDGSIAKMYETEGLAKTEAPNGVIGVMWEKDNKFFRIYAVSGTTQVKQIQINVLAQMVSSFRFLTAQEAME